MKKITIYEFDRLIKALNPRCFEYGTTMQSGFDTRKDEIFIMTCAYSEMSVWTMPNQIFFKTKGGKNTLCLSGVKHILIPDDLSLAHIVLEFTIVCSNAFDESIETEYKIVAGEMMTGVQSVYLVPLPFLSAFAQKE